MTINEPSRDGLASLPNSGGRRPRRPEEGKMAKNIGVQVLIENHDGITIDPDVCIEILDAVGPSLLPGIVIDTGNFNPVRAEGVAAILENRDYNDVDATAAFEGIAKVAPRTALVHVKCHGLHPDGRTKVYDVPRALHIIRDAGFKGPLSLELEAVQADSTWEGIRDSLKMIEVAMVQDAMV